MEELIAYYTQLLIIQYSQGVKARAEVALLAREILADGVFLDVQNAYNLTGNNTAVGKQLDVLGKYAGVDRYYSQLTLTNYFSAIPYTQVGLLPSSPPQFGFNTYASFGGFDYNGLLAYGDVIAANNALTDYNFLQLILLAIINNNSNFSDGSIDSDLYKFFGTNIRAEDTGGMGMIFYISSTITPLMQAIIAKKLLPKPMAVGATIISSIGGLMYDFTTYAQYGSGYNNPFGYGFTTYAQYGSVNGQILTYNQISLE